MILLDTDTCIEMLRGNKRVIKKRGERRDDETAISVMTAAELFYGAELSTHPEHNLGLVEGFLLSMTVIRPDSSILRKFGELKAGLKRDGHPLPDADIFIAATALSGTGILVTGNGRHFERFQGLRIENWIR